MSCEEIYLTIISLLGQHKASKKTKTQSESCTNLNLVGKMIIKERPCLDEFEFKPRIIARINRL